MSVFRPSPLSLVHFRPKRSRPIPRLAAALLLLGLVGAPFGEALAQVAPLAPPAPTNEGRFGEKMAPVESPEAKQGRQPPGKSSLTPDEKTGPDWTTQQVGKVLAQTGHLMSPVGQIVNVPGRVMDVALVRTGKFLVVKTDRGPAIVDTAEFKKAQTYSVPERDAAEAENVKSKAKEKIGWGDFGGSMHGLAVGEDDATVYLTGKSEHLFIGQVSEAGELTFVRSVSLAIGKKKTNPLGVAVAPGGKRAVVALALANAAAVVDLEAGRMIATIPVGVCPYDAAISRDGRTAFVSNFGGSIPHKGDKTEKTTGMTKEGTEVAVDDRAVALRGTVSVIDLTKRSVVGEIETGIHPQAMTLSPDGLSLYVIDAGGDGVAVIDVAQRKLATRLNTKPRADLPFGSLANGLAVSADGKTLFTANAGNNAIAMLDLQHPERPPFAFLGAGGFPGAICVRGDALFCGNVTAYSGSLQKATIPSDPAVLKKLTDTAAKSFHFTDILRSEAAAAPGVRPQPIPVHVGEPSPLRHVVYIIKENKKFDQVLGDIGRGNCDPKLCEFPRAATPNTHALADEFVLLDNYYCGGVLSCDGHQWATQGLTSPYREKDWSNVHCVYDFGLDPLCFAGCGFLWDHVIRHGHSFRNFGEFGYGAIPKGSSWADNYATWKSGAAPAKIGGTYTVEAVRQYSDLRYPGWELLAPDQIRADVFLTALSEFEKAGQMPELVVIYLPNDHTKGGSSKNPTPRAYVADNDLAMGRIMEGLSSSPFWKDMAVFINEDDPQTGADHVDGHRSFCLVASPFAKRGGTVVSTFYNQASVLHTICQIFGAPPMNQSVAMAPLMSACFQDAPDYTPFHCRPAEIALNEMNPDPAATKSKTQARLAPQTEKLDFSSPDKLGGQLAMFSRWEWSTVHGDAPFPARYEGAHGKGLKALGLRLDRAAHGDDDED